MVPVSYNLRSLAVRRTTTAATALGIALVVFVFASVLMFSRGLTRTLGRSARPDLAVVLRKGADAEGRSSFDETNIPIIVNAAGVARDAHGEANPLRAVVVGLRLPKVGTAGLSSLQVRGVGDLNQMSLRIVAGRAPAAGTDEALVGAAIRGRFRGTDLDQAIEFPKGRRVRVVGVFEDGGSAFESEVWTDLDVLRSSFGLEGQVSSVRVRLTSATAFEGYKNAIEQNRQLGVEVFREPDYFDRQSGGMNLLIRAMALIISFFFSVGAMIGATITMNASIAQRQREIGTLRALGFSRGAVLFSFLLESVTLALVGGLLGASAAISMRFVKFSMLNMVSGAEIVFAFEPTPEVLGTAFGAAAVMGLVGGFFPALRASLIRPLEAIRG